jgi:tetratricopeptide (TPR) repeat protein
VRAGQGEQAAVALSDLHARLQHPAWVEATLTEAYVQAGDRDAAIDLLEARLERGQDLPLGERLRLQARVATLRYKPVVAAAVYRALVDLDSDDVESGIRLIESEVDALLGDSARKSLAQLAALPTTRNDPRLILLRSRIASLDSDFELALREAAAVARVALRPHQPARGVSAALAEAAALNAQGRLDEAARLLAESDRLWSGRVGSEVLLDLRMRRVRLLRELGRLADSQQVLDTLQSEFTGPLPRARMGIEAALLRLATARVDEADAVLRQIKPAIHRSGDANLIIAWLNAAAIAAIARNAPDSAGQLFAQAFAMARENGLAGRHVALQVNAGTALMRQKRSVEADEQWQQALETFEALGDRRGQAICLGNLAASASIQGKLERSVELNTRALALFRELHLSGSQARTAYNLALAATRDGSLDQARSYFREAGEVWQANGSADLAMRAAIGQAEIELIRGEFDAAERVMAALGHTAPASPLTASHALAMKARISLAQGKLVESRQLHEQALALRKQDGNEGWITLSELELLRNDLLAGRDPVAIQIAAESLARRFAGLGEVRDEARAWLLVVDAQLSLHRRDDARRSLERVKMANRIFGDRMVAFDLEWAVAWASDREERTLRLRALRQRASDEGYLAQSARAGWALQAGEANEDSAWKTHSVTLPPYARAGATIP